MQTATAKDINCTNSHHIVGREDGSQAESSLQQLAHCSLAAGIMKIAMDNRAGWQFNACFRDCPRYVREERTRNIRDEQANRARRSAAQAARDGVWAVAKHLDCHSHPFFRLRIDEARTV